MAYHISSGVISTGITLYSDYMYIFSGGIANNTTVNSGGDLYIYAGGTATAITENGGYVDVKEGATVTFTPNTISGLVLSSGGATLHSGTVAISTTVNSGGSLVIYSGGTATAITENGGYVDVAEGANVTFTPNTISGLVLDDYTAASLHSGTVANSTTVEGYLEICSGGVANNTTVNEFGALYIHIGGVANHTTVNSYGYLLIYAGGVANYTTVNSSGALDIYSGGVVSNTTVSSGGELFVENGGIVTGKLHIADGGYVDVGWEDLEEIYDGSATFNFDLRNHTTADTALINNYSALQGNWDFTLTVGADQAAGEYILADNVASFDHTITVGDGTVTYGTLSFTASPDVANTAGPVARITTPSDQLNGHSFSYDGKTYTLKLENRQLRVVVDGEGKVVIFKGTEKTFEGPESNDAVLQRNADDTMRVYQGGVANRTAVRTGGKMFVHKGGAANAIGVSSGGILTVEGNGIAHIVTVRSGGVVKVLDKGTTYSASIIGGVVSNYGDVNDTFVSGGGVLEINKTAQAVNTLIKTGGTVIVKESENDKGARQTQVTADGVLKLLNGGKALETTAATGGKVLINQGGVAEKSHVSSGGVIHVSQGGAANLTSVYSSGLLTVFREGTANDTVLYSKGVLHVNNGGIANRTVVSSGGTAYIYTKGQANTLSVEIGSVCVSGGTVGDLTVNDRGKVFIYDNGMVNKAGVNVSGSMQIYSGGKAAQITLNSGGLVYVNSAGTVAGAEINNYGSMFVSYGAAVNNLKIQSAGYLALHGKATGVKVNEVGRMHVYQGGVAGNCTLTGGQMFIYLGGKAYAATIGIKGNLQISNGLADKTTVSELGEMYVCADGIANNTTVKSLGAMYITSGGIHKGTLQIEKGSTVSAENGSIIDFTIVSRTAEDDYLINDLALIEGTPTYTITVAADQENGTYKLAAGASGFSGSIAVGDDKNVYGSVSLGSALNYNGVDYTLTNVDGNLNLTISGNAPVTVEQDRFFTGAFDGSATDMLMSVTNGKVSIYANNAVWAEMPLDDGWNVVGVADCNGDGKADILRQHTSGLLIGEVSNGNGTFTPQVLNSVGSGWGIEGTGDFNGDGEGDVLIANPTAASDGNPDYSADQPPIGLLGYWKGGTEWTLINGYSPEWEMIATGDFNADGKTDMLWRNEFIGAGDLTYNAYCTWIVDNANDWRMVSVANPDEWDFLCSGDFNADGCNDIAMINGDGVVGIWGVSDGYMNSWSILSAVDTATWELAGVGDFNGDGTDDIAWCNTESGLTGYWQITNKTLASWQNIATVA